MMKLKKSFGFHVCYSQFQTDSSTVIAAYEAFQRVAIGLELVTRSLRSHRTFVQHYGRFWQLAQRTANRIVEAAYVSLIAQGISVSVPNGKVLLRSIVPRRLRCTRLESRRNIRNWVILNDSLKIAKAYHQVFRAQSERL